MRIPVMVTGPTPTEDELGDPEELLAYAQGLAARDEWVPQEIVDALNAWALNNDLPEPDLFGQRSEHRHPGHPDQKVHGRRGPRRADLGGGVDTQSEHSTVSGGRRTYDADRVRDVHDPYVEGQKAGTTPVDSPTLTIMGGGSGAGKGTLIRSGKVNLENSVKADSDEAKAAIPEYQARLKVGDPSAASYAHEESSDMAKRLVAESLGESRNATLDGTGDSSIDKLEAKVAAGRAAGAERVVAEYVTIPTSTAVQRATERAERSGRVVPTEVIEGTHRSVSQVVPKAIERNLFDEVRVWDNSGPAPRKIFEQKDGVSSVLDQTAWDAFLAKGSDGVRARLDVEATRVGDLVRGVDDDAVGDELLDLYDESVPRLTVGGAHAGDPAVDLRHAPADLGSHGDEIVAGDHKPRIHPDRYSR